MNCARKSSRLIWRMTSGFRYCSAAGMGRSGFGFFRLSSIVGRRSFLRLGRRQSELVADFLAGQSAFLPMAGARALDDRQKLRIEAQRYALEVRKFDGDHHRDRLAVFG